MNKQVNMSRLVLFSVVVLACCAAFGSAQPVEADHQAKVEKVTQEIQNGMEERNDAFSELFEV